ncbi:ShlB/FhaC/HecB family hemolysin secretion/activation protein [Comamonas suwonensis]|uniref:ShlB/FhaC/HecB family hemolysin secretion/activation protein n=1 Tax=Comamonas suwonensis TaxID=2606214 RepID=A0A843B502_9BURK|nr:ShlB/FhaC/HecB family hemolysin secretion/activation protein [Comamonas suwonensis]MBI1625861.1 ShlB/FhaC/HecB family hemolysin secretion/activation protein [Comamonas suwonensis]
MQSRTTRQRHLGSLIPTFVLTAWAPLASAQLSGNPLNSLPQTPESAQHLQAAPKPVQVQLEKPQPSPQDITSVQVAVRGVNVQGSTAIPFEEVSALFTPFINGTHTVGELNAATQKVSELYQRHGYALSFAYLPPQDFANGAVQVMVVEGFVQSLNLEGNFGRSEELIRELAQPLLNERPLTSKTFQHQTQLMARLPGVQITASASLPSTTDGAVPLVIKSKHKPIAVTIGGEARKPTPRLIASVTLNDPLWAGSQLQASAMLQNPDKERFGSIGFTQQLTPEGTQARVSYSDYRSFNPPATRIPGIDDLTQQRKLDFNISHPWILSNTTQLSTTAGLYAINYSRELADSQASLLREEKVRTLYAQMAWASFGQNTARSASVLLAHGLDSMGAYKNTDLLVGSQIYQLTNPAKLDFTRVSADYAQRHRFANKMGAAFAVGGQYSKDILPTPEKISFGSTRFGRGYQAGEFSGDSGMGASAELNYQLPINQPWIKSAEPYLLYEWARTHQQTSGISGNTLRSVSLGLRLSDNRYYALDVAMSKPQGDSSINNPNRKLRYSLVLSYNLDP